MNLDILSPLKYHDLKIEKEIVKMQRKQVMVLICVILSSLMIILSPQSTSISIKNFFSEKIDQSQERDDGPVSIRNIEWQEFVPSCEKTFTC